MFARMPVKPATFFGAVAFAAVHFAAAVFPLLQWSGNGEWYAAWDMPLEILLRLSQSLSDFIMRGSGTRYVLYIAIGGTMMYGTLGALVGYVFDSILQKVRRRHAT
jgi:hypothetical protein